MTTPPPKSLDPASEYLMMRGCPSHVWRAGLKGLVMTWEKVVQELVFDGYRYGLADFAKDLERRALLDGTIAHLGDRVPEAFRARIAAADLRYQGATDVASRCLLGDDEAGARGIERERHWWFFRLPRRFRPNFARDLEAARIRALVDGAAPQSD